MAESLSVRHELAKSVQRCIRLTADCASRAGDIMPQIQESKTAQEYTRKQLRKMQMFVEEALNDLGILQHPDLQTDERTLAYLFNCDDGGVFVNPMDFEKEQKNGK